MIQKIVNVQRDFSAGVLDPLALRRDDTKIMRSGLRAGANMRPTAVGPVTRRGGHQVRWTGAGRPGKVRPAGNRVFYIEFSDETLTFRLAASPGAAHTTLTGCPWDSGDVAALNWDAAGIYLVVCHRDGTMRPQVFTYDRAGDTWTRDDFAFATSPTGEWKQPYYRFAATRGIKMIPSDATGAITLTFDASGAIVDPDHVGARFRYIDREVVVTAINSPTQAAATVTDELPKSYYINGTGSAIGAAVPGTFAGFSVGEIVEGETSQARGEVTGIVDVDSIRVQIHEGYTGFYPSETVVGQKSRCSLAGSGYQAIENPKYSTYWDEEFMSDFRGWPGGVTFDRQRVIFYAFPQFPQAIIWSAVGTVDDFRVTGDADGAIFEYVPGECSVLHVTGGPDQFVLTDNGIYYVPISASTPLSPGAVEFRLIPSEDAADTVRPVWTPQGLVFVSTHSSRIKAIQPTGQTAMPYQIADLSEYHGHLINAPVALAAVAIGADSRKLVFLYVVNGDGTVAMARYNRGEEWVGWFPWSFAGQVTDAVGGDGEALLRVEYDTAGGTVACAETYSEDYRLDGAIDKDDATALALFEGEALDAWSDRWHGKRTIGAGGTISGDALPDGAYLGHAFTASVQPFVPNMGDGEAIGQRLRRRKIAKAMVTVDQTSGFAIGNKIIASYLAGENNEAPPPRRTTTYKYRSTGRSYQPEMIITQDVPGWLTVVEIAMEVTV